jgi:hypothetical protein
VEVLGALNAAAGAVDLVIVIVFAVVIFCQGSQQLHLSAVYYPG